MVKKTLFIRITSVIVTITFVMLTSACANKKASVYPKENNAYYEQQKNKKKSKNRLLGIGIGAGVGTAIALIPAISQQSKNCSAAGDPGDCRTFQTFFWGLVPVSALVFGLIGLGVGSVVKTNDYEAAQ
jgi:hypothetical protein